MQMYTFAYICGCIYVDACVMYTGTCIGERGVVTWHRRRKIRSPAATDQALRGARPMGSPQRLTVALMGRCEFMPTRIYNKI